MKIVKILSFCFFLLVFLFVAKNVLWTFKQCPNAENPIQNEFDECDDTSLFGQLEKKLASSWLFEIFGKILERYIVFRQVAIDEMAQKCALTQEEKLFVENFFVSGYSFLDKESLTPENDFEFISHSFHFLSPSDVYAKKYCDKSILPWQKHLLRISKTTMPLISKSCVIVEFQIIPRMDDFIGDFYDSPDEHLQKNASKVFYRLLFFTFDSNTHTWSDPTQEVPFDLGTPSFDHDSETVP